MNRAFTILTIAILCLFGCEDRDNAKPIAVYDNNGGLAGGGLRITFYDSGKYELESYTDIIDEERMREVGTYTKKDSTYVLTGPKGQSVYHVHRISGIEYLLDERTYEEYRRTSAKESLRRPMQRKR